MARPKPYIEMGERIKKCRKILGKNQFELALFLNIGYKTVARAERGHIKLNDLLLYQISYHAKQPLKWLLGDKDYDMPIVPKNVKRVNN